MNPVPFVPSPPAHDALDSRTRRVFARLLVVVLIALPCIALAAPPAWAPAHGWRAKSDPRYAGYSGRKWDHDYGISLGRCDRAAIGAVLGGVTGGVIGSQVGEDGQRTVATVLGAVIGATIGAEIGRRMDHADRSCVGQALELAQPGQTITWTNYNTRVSYQLTPTEHGDEVGNGCRRFRLVATGSFGLSEGRTVACPDPDNSWTLAPETRLGRR